MIEESLRFLNLRSWRWLPGMLTTNGDRVKMINPSTGDVFLDRGFVTLDEIGNFAIGYPRIDPMDLPNPQDPATIGAMLEVIEMASGLHSSLCYSRESDSWMVEMWNDVGHFVINGSSKEDALLAVFEYLDENL